MAENREYKSDVFSMLLEEPENALDVYNALNGTDYDNKDMVVVHMLEKGVSLSIRNDASFIEGNNVELLERCKVLRGYMYFVDKVRYYKEQYKDKGHNLTRAIEAAIDDCISHHILEDFFRQRRAEVVKVMQLDYTWERREKLIRAEEYQDGLETGRREGRSEGRREGVERGETLLSALLQKLLAAGRTEDVEKMASDKSFREELFKEFGMKS